MNIWLITIGEPLPIKNKNVRLLRCGLLAEELISRGHIVVWWSSTFNHSNKKHHLYHDKKINLIGNYYLYLLHTIGYKKNFSFNRYINHIALALKFAIHSRKEPPPDILLCSIPTPEFGIAAIRYGKKHNVPVVVDIRDMWPDIYLSRIPFYLRWLAKPLMVMMLKQIRYVCKGAKAIIGITEGYVKWGLEYAGRDATVFDKYFPLGYCDKAPSNKDLKKGFSFWELHGIKPDNDEFIICLISNFVRQLELETVIEVARRLYKADRKVRFVFCGSGEAIVYFKKLSIGCKNIVFTGWIERPEIYTIMKMAHAGIAPYKSTKDFVISIPNKAIEYMSAGLPIISSLQGTLKEVLSATGAGLTYENNNPEELFQIVCHLYDNPEKLKIMSHNSYKLFKNNYSGEIVYPSMCDYLVQVADSNCQRKNDMYFNL
ncbi:MAG: glycosyltransferase family 4 protein [Proteobacteria bacterium]|nr:glycosyltransferase family 4 protein [Pseudomonadota bacterium]